MSKIQNDFNATLVEEQTNAIRKLTTDNLALISENDSLKKKIHELKHPEEGENVDDEPVTGRRQVKPKLIERDPRKHKVYRVYSWISAC